MENFFREWSGEYIKSLSEQEIVKSDAVVIKNRWMTPDGTILESKHRHDYVRHEDANGKTYAIDGGPDNYLRFGGTGSPEDLTNLCVYSDAPHEVLREEIVWGTYGKNGDEPLHHLKISEMTTKHLIAVITTQDHIAPYIKHVMDVEIEERLKNE